MIKKSRTEINQNLIACGFTLNDALAHELLSILNMRAVCNIHGEPMYKKNLNDMQHIIIEAFASFWEFIPIDILRIDQRLEAPVRFQCAYVNTLDSPHAEKVDALFTKHSNIDKSQCLRLKQQAQKESEAISKRLNQMR